ncbi:hypothetical protein SH668x_001241 [Planctomicrobium sp. SH668]|uniref:hypothetical protein n=1 Tax=Planctomicrobium sp. SH668 TaxID=3448126 RepID=UPI003F5C7719
MISSRWLPDAEFSGVMIEQDDDEMPDFILEVSNGAPVRFSGELLAASAPQDTSGAHARWHELNLYKSNSGKFVLEVKFRSNSKDSSGTRIEPDQNDVYVCEDREDIMQALDEIDPNEYVIGFPIGVQNWEAKQNRLTRGVKLEFERLSGELLIKAAMKDPTLAEEI